MGLLNNFLYLQLLLFVLYANNVYSQNSIRAIEDPNLSNKTDLLNSTSLLNNTDLFVSTLLPNDTSSGNEGVKLVDNSLLIENTTIGKVKIEDKYKDEVENRIKIKNKYNDDFSDNSINTLETNSNNNNTSLLSNIHDNLLKISDIINLYIGNLSIFNFSNSIKGKKSKIFNDMVFDDSDVKVKMGPSEMESSSNPEIPPHFLPKDENTSPDLLLPDNHKKIAGVNGAITSVPLRSSPRHFPPNGNPSMRGFQRGSFPIPFQPVKTPYNGMPDAYSGSEIPNINPTMGGSGIQVIITSPPPPSPTPHHLHHPHHPHHPPTPVNYIPEVDENGNFSGNSSMLPPIPLNPNDKNILSPPLNYNNSSRVGNNTLLDGEILSKMVNGTDDGAFLNDTHTQYLFRGVPYFRRMCKCLSDRVPPFKPADNLNETTTNFENGTLISNNSTICRCDLIRHDMLKYHHQNDTYPPPPYHHHHHHHHHHNHTCLHCNSTKFLNKTSHEVRHFHNCSLDKVSHPDLEINEITINNSTNRNKTNLDDLGNERNGNFSNETAVQPIEPFPFYGVSNDTDNKFNHKYITNSTVVSSSEYTTTVVTTVYNISQNEAIKSQLFTIDSNLTNDYTKRSLKTLNINDTNNEIDKINNINNNSSADIQLTSPVFTLIADDISYCGNNTNHLKNIASNFRSVVGKLFNINSNDVLIIEMTPTNINVDCNNKSGNEDGKSGVRFTFM